MTYFAHIFWKEEEGEWDKDVTVIQMENLMNKTRDRDWRGYFHFILCLCVPVILPIVLFTDLKVGEQIGAEDQLTPLRVETLKKDGLGKLFHVLVAENQKGETKQLIGYLFFHYIYSTWQAKAILLTDVYVSPEFSEKSVAKERFILLCKIDNEEGCAQLQWEVKENDRDKIDFVSISSAQNLSAEEGWHKYRFSKEQLLTF